jgi:hypothetical protein
VIAPEPEGGIKDQTSLGFLLRNNLLVSALIFAALEWWRPYFFLTDDNLDGGLPFFSEVGRRLLSGRSPFVSEHLFGGGYNLLRDPDFFAWHPLYLASSLLTATPFRFAIIDVDAFVLLMLATAGFVTLAAYLRREMALPITDGWIMFYSLSFTYSMIALTTGASWLSFLGNHSAMPWLALGILQRHWRRGAGLVALFSVHQILAGHLAPTVSTSIFFSVFALGVSLSRRSILPLGNWVAGYAVALVLTLPLLMPMLGGFFASARAQGVTLEDMQSYNIPVSQFPTTLFFGAAAWIFHPLGHPHTTYTVALGSCAAAWCVFPVLVSLARWRGLELVCLGMLVFGAALICRPMWITEIMIHLPVIRSMRWPFRELLQFQFFFHLLLVLRPPGMLQRIQKFAATFGTIILVLPMAAYPLPPTFNSMNWDRELLFSGGFDRYWEQVRPLLNPTDRIAVIIPEKEVYDVDRFEEPYSLLATYNYAALAGVVNAWGYSPTAPMDQLYTRTYAYYPFGAYRPEQKAALLAERPGLKFITLESLDPLRITLTSGDGPPIDLTPFVPKRIKTP